MQEEARDVGYVVVAQYSSPTRNVLLPHAFSMKLRTRDPMYAHVLRLVSSVPHGLAVGGVLISLSA